MQGKTCRRLKDLTEAAADRTAAFEGRQVEQGSKVLHAGCLCLTLQGCVAHTVQECVCEGGGHWRVERKGKGFIHSGVQYISCNKKSLWSDFFLFITNNVKHL